MLHYVALIAAEGKYFMNTLWQEIRHAARTFARSPVFAAVAVLVLALGIGANTAIFSIVNAVLFRPLPVVAPDELRYLYVTTPQWLYGIPYRDYEYLRQQNDVFTDVAGWSGDTAKLGSGLDTEQVRGETVSANYFDLLGVRPIVGRTFVPDDDTPGAAPAIVISHALWKRRFNSDPEILGKGVDLRAMIGLVGYYSSHRRSYTVIGVMPPEFKGISSVWESSEFWTPLLQRTLDRQDASQERWPNQPRPAPEDSISVFAVGRLKPGVTDAHARGVVATAGRHMRDRNPKTRAEWTLTCSGSPKSRLPFDRTGKVVPGRLAAALMAVSAMVVLIAAANLAGMLMARGVTRRGEVAIRLALGAGRWRVTRQALTESALLSTLGGMSGLLFARVLVGLFLAYMPGRFGGGLSALRLVSLDVPIDIRVLLFTALMCVGAGVVVGLTPALQAMKTDLLSALSGGSVVVPAQARSRLRHGIVIPQVCLSLVLLLAGGVLVRTLLRAELIDRGFRPAHVIYADFELPMPNDRDITTEQRKTRSELRRLLYARLLERARATPNVVAASLSLLTPWDGHHRASVISRDGFATNQNHWVYAGEVSPGYFEAMGIPLLRGRTFDGRDTPSTARVAIVCDALARLLWPGKDPIGEYVAHYDPKSSYPPTWLQVVGIVGEIKPVQFEDRSTPFIYTPLDQQSSAYATTLVVRAYANPAQVTRTISKAINEADPSVEISRCITMTDAIGEVLYPRRIAAAILALSGLIGLLLSAVGLYGVVSYSVAQRVREIGIRAALGARKIDIVKLVLREGVKILLVGLTLGVVLALAAIRVTSSTVVAIPAMDGLTFITVPLLLAAVILLACYVPARRAARVDPMEVLRSL